MSCGLSGKECFGADRFPILLTINHFTHLPIYPSLPLYCCKDFSPTFHFIHTLWFSILYFGSCRLFILFWGRMLDLFIWYTCKSLSLLHNSPLELELYIRTLIYINVIDSTCMQSHFPLFPFVFRSSINEMLDFGVESVVFMYHVKYFLVLLHQSSSSYIMYTMMAWWWLDFRFGSKFCILSRIHTGFDSQHMGWCPIWCIFGLGRWKVSIKIYVSIQSWFWW